MMTNAIQRVETLSHMLQIYSDKRELPKPSPSLTQTQQEHLNYHIRRLSGYPEFLNENWEKYTTLNKFFLEVVREGDEDKLFIIHQVLSEVVPGFSLPIFNQMILSQTRKEVRKVFVLLIKLLSGAYDAPTTKAVRNLANQLLEIFGNYTILDAILFFEECKKPGFKSQYQGISYKGVTVEFVLDWAIKFLEKLDKRKQEQLDDWKVFNSAWVQTLPKEMASKVEAFVLSPANKKKSRDHHKNLKYEQLKMAHEHKVSKMCIKKRLLDATIHSSLKYKVENLAKSEDEVSEIAKENCRVYYQGLCEKVELSESNRNEREIEEALKLKIKQIDIAFQKLKYDELMMEYFTHLHYLGLIPNEEHFTDYRYTLIPKWRASYKIYFIEEIDRDVFPFEEEEYLKIKVLNWAKAHLKSSAK